MHSHGCEIFKVFVVGMSDGLEVISIDLTLSWERSVLTTFTLLQEGEGPLGLFQEDERGLIETGLYIKTLS